MARMFYKTYTKTLRTINYRENRQKPTAFTVISFVLLFITSAAASAQATIDYGTKATFISNFTQFIYWPRAAYQTADSPFVIGILGDDPFHSQIEEAVAGQKVKGHAVIVQRYQNVKDIKTCHILYICNSETERVKEIVASLPNKNTLTVSDIADFTTFGGIIRFINRENKIKLQINLAASKAAELNINPKLLQIAEIVR